jgi:hypothetical protein
MDNLLSLLQSKTSRHLFRVVRCFLKRSLGWSKTSLSTRVGMHRMNVVIVCGAPDLFICTIIMDF